MIRKGQELIHKPKVASVAAAVALALSIATPSQAIEIEAGNWSGSWDTTVSFGSSWRVEERDRNRIGHSNLIELDGGVPHDFNSEGAWSNNGDDANLNFDKGDPFSTVALLTTELGLRHESGFGFFIRGTSYYDYEINNDPEQRFKPISDAAVDEQGQRTELLDAFIYQSWDFEETSMQVRYGLQVINWGESTFIQHGLSEINSIDVTKLRVPGAELKEALLPVNTLWTSIDLSDTLSVEGFVQFEWEPYRTDEPGTYFATQDFTGETGSEIHLGFSMIPEGTPGTIARRLEDKDASDSGQFGLKLAWLIEDWNATEFGFYFVNYNNKRPIISAYAHNGVETTGFFEYLDDIQMYGLSFNTSTDSGISIAGEFTYRKDEPLQIDDVELLFATLEPVGSVASGTSQIPGGAALGEEISGYRLFDTMQFQTTFTQFLGPNWGADQWVVLLEVGANYVADMPAQSELRFNAPGTARTGNDARSQLNGFEGVETNPFADDFSWGYRFVSKWDYLDAVAGWNMYPRVVFEHDVKGTTPGPISNFVEDRKAVTLGLGFDYESTWKADLGYSTFFGAGTANVMGDKDFVAANISYSF